MNRYINVWRVLAIAVLVALAGGVIAWRQGVFQLFGAYRPANSLIVIAPYRYAGTWVFDDAAAGLRREPFVGGVPQMMDYLVRDIPNATNGFRLLFSTQMFPGYQQKLVWVRPGGAGNYYRIESPPMEGWICPALFRYYRTAPKELYVKAEPKI
jgi:hypothetical protein